jgi:hypothetical protein
MWDVILLVDNRKMYCNKAILSIWSPVFETMFKSNFKEKESSEINLPGRNLIFFCFHLDAVSVQYKSFTDKGFDDIYEMLQVIYPPNKPINALNIEKLLELADEYQITELNKRCRQFLMQQRGL